MTRPIDSIVAAAARFDTMATRLEVVAKLLDATRMVVASTRRDEPEELALCDALDVLDAVRATLDAELRAVADRKGRELLERGR